VQHTRGTHGCVWKLRYQLALIQMHLAPGRRGRLQLPRAPDHHAAGSRVRRGSAGSCSPGGEASSQVRRVRQVVQGGELLALHRDARQEAQVLARLGCRHLPHALQYHHKQLPQILQRMSCCENSVGARNDLDTAPKVDKVLHNLKPQQVSRERINRD
jgi:hypothetical protein